MAIGVAQERLVVDHQQAAAGRSRGPVAHRPGLVVHATIRTRCFFGLMSLLCGFHVRSRPPSLMKTRTRRPGVHSHRTHTRRPR